jgi:hypothetical protein
MALSFYIYYHIKIGASAAAEKRIREMQETLTKRTGIAGRLLKKRGEPQLWMEVYENVAETGGFEQALNHAVEEYGLRLHLQPGSQRHTECFFT